MKKTIIICLVLLSVVCIVYFVINKKSTQSKPSNKNFTLKDYYILNTESNLMYINNKYSYYLALPKNWVIDSNYPYNIIETPGFYDPIAQEQTTESELVMGMKIATHIENVGQIDFEQYVDSLYLDFEVTSKKHLTIGELPAIEIVTYNLGDSVATYIKKDNLIYTIGAHYNGGHYLDLYRDIVANNFWLGDNLYQTITDPEDKFLGTGECMTNPEFLDLIAQAQDGEIKKLVINNQEFVITPNYENWPNEKFVGFNQDETAICAVGGRYPLEIYDDQLIWYRNLE